MKKLYILICIAATGMLNAQTFSWLQTPEINIALNPDLVGYCVASDAAGHAYFAGFRDHASPYNDIYGDCWFNKYDLDGTLMSSQTFTGKCSIFDMATDPDGNVIMAMGWRESVTIGSVTLTTTETGVEPMVAKFDSSGALLWHYRPMIGTGLAPFFKAIAVDGSGNIYAAYDNFNSCYIKKLSATGEEMMTITMTNTKLISSVSVDSDGNIYGAGSCAENNAIYAGVAAPTSFDYNTWIVKFSANGVYQWVRYVEDITCSKPQVRASSPDAVYFSSYLFGPYDFGGITANGPAAGSFNDFFITRLDADGNFQWVRDVPGTAVATPGLRTFLATDIHGNAYFTGSTRFASDWGNGQSTSPEGFQNDGLILKYGPDGTVLLARNVGGASIDRADAITIAPDGDIIACGMARSNSVFGDITHESAGTAPYPWLARIDMPELRTATFDAQALHLWPNPAHDIVNISGSGTTGTIYNVLGQRVVSFSSAQKINVGALPSGIYIVRTGNQAIKLKKE